MVGAAHPLQEGGDGPGRAHLAHELHRPDVDAELERGRGDQGPQVAGPQPVLDPLAAVLGQAPVVGGHLVGPEPLAQQVGQALGHPPGVDEDEGGAVLAHVVGDAVDDLAELLGRGHRRRARSRAARCDTSSAGRARSRRWPSTAGARPRSSSRAVCSMGRWVADRPMRWGRRPELEVLEPLEGEGQVRPPLVAGQGVDLVHDDRLHLAERRPAALGGDQEVEALGRRDQEGRRRLHHGGPGPGRGVPGAHGHGDGRDAAAPARVATAAISARGRSRFWWMSTARAFSGET